MACFASAVAAGASCGEHQGKLAPEPASKATPAGAAGQGGERNVAVAGDSAGAGGELAVPAAGGSAPESEGGAGTAPGIPAACIYRTDVEGSSAAGAGGAGGSDAGAGGEGGAGPLANLTKATSRILGDYLADEAGRSLYVFGADSAGDCESPPVSACDGDCLRSWPVFHADPRRLAPGLEAAAFGSFVRGDGKLQTTYYGWPLYYYANDAKAGDITGHGSGVWGLAELTLPNVIVRRVDNNRLLADGAGRTLYAFAEDELGTLTREPVSACSGACLDQHPAFSPRYVGAISTLEARDFTSFVRPEGGTQVAYKGAPLYYSRLDTRPGTVNGTEDAGFTIVLK